MKQNVVMVRKMGVFDVMQRTKDGYFDGNSLLYQWNTSRNTQRRRMIEFLESPKTLEFIDVIKEESQLRETDNADFKVVSTYKGKSTKNGKEKDEVWMHPYLFIDFAMWINPKFKFQVIKFVYDELIKKRNDAGDGYVKLSSSGVKLKGYNFVEVAKAIQWIVYKTTGKELRQLATENQLIEINDIQTKLAFAIDFGYIKKYQQLLLEMRKMYKIKHLKTPF